MVCHLYLVRHGETADNARRIFQGQGGSGLNRLGRAQAARLAERMKHLPLATTTEGVLHGWARIARRPSVIVSSDLDRAVETATIVGGAIGVEVRTDVRLREVDVGTWTGKSYDEVERLFPEEWAAWDAGLDVRRGGGETYGELAARVGAALSHLASRHDGTRVLVVSHGGAIKSFISKILGVTGDGMRVLAGVTNAGVTIVESDARRFRLHTWNDSSHLEGLRADEHSD